MIHTDRARRRRARAAAALLLVPALAVALASGHATGDPQAPGLPAPQPDVSLPAIPAAISSNGSSFVMLGADAAGDAFAYTLEPPTRTALGSVNGKPVPSDWTTPSTNRNLAHFVIYQHTAASGWHLTQEALDQNGAPLTQFAPFGYGVGAIVPAGQVSPGGAAAIAGTDGQSGSEVVLLRGSNGQFRAVPSPPATLLGADQMFSSANPALAPIDDSGGPGLLIAPSTGFGSASALGVLHYDGSSWTAEQVVPPSGVTVQRVLGMSATSPHNAYLLAQTSSSGGIAVFKREVTSAGAQWAAVKLDGSEGSLYSAGSGSGYSQLGAPDPSIGSNTAGAQPLTATADGAWADGSFTDSQGRTQTFTIHISVTEQSDGPHGALSSWCNDASAGLCDHSLPASLPSQLYRSIAWAGGSPYGSRIITGLPGGGILSLQGTSFRRVDGVGQELADDGSAAFLSPTEGWTGGAPPTEFTANPASDPLQPWPTPFREPLTAIASQPGTDPGALNAQAIAVGNDGEVARYTPGQGWAGEPLLTAAGVRATPRLRAVAWPTNGFAYAVGDNGAMWRWNGATGFWESDPAVPLNFNGDLTGIAFNPSNPDVGYAVGLNGVLLRYGKTWTQDALPPGLQSANFTSVTFAGSEAIAAFQTARPRDVNNQPYGPGPDSGLVVNDGSGWRLDQQEQSIMTPPASGAIPSQPVVSAVAGLPDGGAVAAGEGVLLERDAAGAPWRLARDPLPGYSVVAAAAFRDGPAVRAVLSVDPLEQAGRWPAPSPVSPPGCALTNSCSGNQGLPTRLGSYDLPANGWLLRETSAGWEDVQHNAFPAANQSQSGADNPARDDVIQALLLDPSGSSGWAVGGESGVEQNPGLQSGNPNVVQLHTAGIYRYPGTPTPPTGASVAPPVFSPGQVTVALGGDAECLAACANRDPRIGLGPPTWLSHAIEAVAAMSRNPGGPSAFVYTGGIVPAPMRALDGSDPSVAGEISYFASHAATAAGALPFAPVISANEVFGGVPAAAFMQDFPSMALPTSGRFPEYYAFDASRAGGGAKLRVVVIDDATPSAAQALANGTGSDAQYQFLTSELAGARSAHIPVIVVGSRTLSRESVTGDTAPVGADSIAKLLVDGGVSAYFFDSPNSNAQYQIPAGAAQTIPSYGTGSLSYEAWASSGNQFGESGYLLVSVDPTRVARRP
jgi:hypothetical protein